MLAEVWAPLLRGAFRLGSSVKACDGGGSKEACVVSQTQLDAQCPRIGY